MGSKDNTEGRSVTPRRRHDAPAARRPQTPDPTPTPDPRPGSVCTERRTSAGGSGGCRRRAGMVSSSAAIRGGSSGPPEQLRLDYNHRALSPVHTNPVPRGRSWCPASPRKGKGTSIPKSPLCAKPRFECLPCHQKIPWVVEGKWASVCQPALPSASGNSATIRVDL